MSTYIGKSAAVLVAVVAFSCSDAFGQRPARGEYTLESQLSKASGSYVSALRDINGRLDKLPAKVDGSKWSGVKEGAKEIFAKATSLLDAIKETDRLVTQLERNNSPLQVRLKEIVGEFNRLAADAESHAAKLPDPLATTVRREKEVYSRGAQIVERFQAHYQTLLASHKDHIAGIKQAEPILERMRKGASLYVEVAELGGQLDQAMNTLNAYVDNLNAILDMFDKLGDSAEDALAATDPTSSPVVGFLNWKARGGTFSCRARLVAVEDDSIKLEKDTGEIVTLEMASLNPSTKTLVNRCRPLLAGSSLHTARR